MSSAPGGHGAGAIYVTTGFGPPAEAYWRMEIEVETLLARSFPPPGREGEIRGLFADSIDTDAMGLGTRRQGEQIWFTYSNVVLTATR